VFALRRDWIAAALVSFATPFAGFFIFRVNHPAIFSVCYAPWLLWAWVRCIQAPTVRATAAGAGVWFVANWCLLASGTVKEAYMLLASLNAAGLAAFVFTRDPVRLQLRKAVVLAVAGVALLLASMPLWLTFADALVQSHTFSDQPAAYRIPSRLLIGFFDDLFYRELDGSRRIFCPSGNLLLFAGVLWCFARLRLQLVDPLVRWLVVGGLVALGLAVDWIPSAWVLSIPGLRSVGHLHNTFSCVALVFSPCWPAADSPPPGKPWRGRPAACSARSPCSAVCPRGCCGNTSATSRSGGTRPPRCTAGSRRSLNTGSSMPPWQRRSPDWLSCTVQPGGHCAPERCPGPPAGRRPSSC
jgi:hypothetical protein